MLSVKFIEHFLFNPLDNAKCRCYYMPVQPIKHRKGGTGMGNKIKETREALKMTQEELAEKSGVSRTTISALENGIDRATSTKTLIKLARAMNTTVDAIFLLEVFSRLNNRQETRQRKEQFYGHLTIPQGSCSTARHFR